MRSLLRSPFFASSLSALLFILLFPVLDIFIHPVSVLHGDYIPFVMRLSDLYWNTPFLGIALLGVPLLLGALLLLAQSQQLGLMRISLLALAPFSLALFFQYFIAVQLDKYLVEFPAAGLPIPWNDVFQLSFAAGCFQLLLLYASFVAALWALVFVLRKTTVALTHRWRSTAGRSVESI